MNQKVGSGKIVKVLRGSKAQDLNHLHPADLPTYGMLSATSEAQIRDVLSQMATDGFLSISEGSMPIVRFGERAAETVAPNFHYEIKKIERKHAAKRAESPSVALRPWDRMCRATETRNCSPNCARCGLTSPANSVNPRISSFPIKRCATWCVSAGHRRAILASQRRWCAQIGSVWRTVHGSDPRFRCMNQVTCQLGE